AAGAGRSARGEESMPPIVDTHQHLWDLGKFRLPWLKGAPSLDRSFVMDDYLKATEGLGVVKSVYMEVDVDPSQQAAEAAYVLDLCRRGVGPLAGAVISGRPAADGFKAYINRCKDDRFLKGVRRVLHGPETPPGYALEAAFLKGI